METLTIETRNETIKNNGKCEFWDECGFIQDEKRIGEFKRGWTELYCDSMVKSCKCIRKRVCLETGRHPDDNMTPTGHYI